MNEELINTFYTKAIQNLKVAELCFENDCFDDCANRAYYAVFHIAVVALAQIGITSTKNEHKWVQSNFCQELINKRKRLPSELKNDYTFLLKTRNNADYSLTIISKKIAKEALKTSKNFVTQLSFKIIPI